MTASDLDKAHAVERTKRLANRRAPDAEGGGKLALRWKPITRTEFFRPDKVLYLSNDIFVYSRSFDWAEQNFTSRAKGNAPANSLWYHINLREGFGLMVGPILCMAPHPVNRGEEKKRPIQGIFFQGDSALKTCVGISAGYFTTTGRGISWHVISVAFAAWRFTSTVPELEYPGFIPPEK